MLPQLLNKGDTIAILAPAKGIEDEFIEFAVEIIEKQGFKAVVSQNCLGHNNYFSGCMYRNKEPFFC